MYWMRTVLSQYPAAAGVYEFFFRSGRVYWVYWFSAVGLDLRQGQGFMSFFRVLVTREAPHSVGEQAGFSQNTVVGRALVYCKRTCVNRSHPRSVFEVKERNTNNDSTTSPVFCSLYPSFRVNHCFLNGFR